MPDRFKTLTQTIGPVNAGDTGQFNLNIANDNINIVKIEITPTILGGVAIYQIYDRDTFVAVNLVYGTNPVAGIYYDPVMVDDSGAVVVTPGAMRFIVPYYDRDETEELHVRITNMDSQAKSFEVVIVYEVPMIDVS